MKQRVLTLVFDKDSEIAALREILLSAAPKTPHANALLEALREAAFYDGDEPRVGEFPHA